MATKQIWRLAIFGSAFVASASPAIAQLDGVGAAARQNQRMEEQHSFFQDVGDHRNLGPADLLKRIAKYRGETEQYRQNAVRTAEQAQASVLPAGSGSRIRDALAADLTFWYNSLPVSSRDWDAMRKQWLVPVGSLNDQQWAQQRAAWYVARDTWLRRREEDTQLNRH